MSQEEEVYILMARYISRQGSLLGWFNGADTPLSLHPVEGVTTAVAVQHSNGDYSFEPPHAHASLVSAIERLNVAVAFTMSSEITSATLEKLTPHQTYLNVPNAGIRIPIVQSLDDVYSELADNVHCTACIVRRENLVLVWADAVGSILHNGTTIKEQLLEMLWGVDMLPESIMLPGRMSYGQAMWSRHQSYQSSINLAPATPGALDETKAVYIKAMALEEGPGEDEVEELAGELPPRPVTYISSIKVGLAVILVILTNSLAVANLLNEFAWDGGVLRFAMIAILPITALFSIFIMVVIIGCIFQLFLPLGPALGNTKYYSAIKPKPSRHRDYELPHITIQMPVYKEGLKGVIVPTIMSLLIAIQDYEERGGTASIFVNDDGMQLIGSDLAAARKQYYAANNIGYCSRLPNMRAPKKSFWGGKAQQMAEDEKSSPQQRLSNEVRFERKGKFKKASNMNYCLDFSNRVEDELRRLTEEWMAMRGVSYDSMTSADDEDLYNQALSKILQADQGRTWAAGNVRIGEVILIVDCDTRVPADCLIYGALEMHESPEVAIIQHGSGVMQVVGNLFENGITYFTNLVYTYIKYGVGAGDVAPFVGHNAFLRWKAVQSVSFVDKTDGLTKYWSDSHVSEDFDISLRLQVAGNVVRLATYHNGGFKEGVSFTLYDELARWEKYAYGCNELVFHPLYQWIYKGPITPMFWRFIMSNIPVSSKVVITGYIFTYYAIAAGLWLTLTNYILLGLFPDNIDHFYLPSWEVFITCVFVFNGVSPLAFAMLRHRLKEKQFLPALREGIKWFPFTVIFFGGLSLHCCRALLCHMFSVNIEWTSTAKELGPTGIYISLDKMIKSCKYIWLIILIIAGAMIYLGLFAPWGYTITSPIIIVPLAIQIASHFLLPLTLGLV